MENFIRIDKLAKKKEENPYDLGKIEGVGPTRKKRLEESGIKFLQDICMISPQTLARITGLDEKPTCEKIWLNTRQRLEELNVIRPAEMTVKEELEYEENIPRLSTRCIAIDSLFDGGIPQETSTEVFGKFGTGKTQFILTLCVEAINDGHEIVVVDCEGTFKIKRLIQIAEARGYIKNEEDKEKFLSKMKKYTTSNSFETRSVLENLTGYVLEKNVKLIVVDGVIGQIRKEFEGRGELSDRQQYLKPFMERLGSMPSFLRCWVVYSNQVLESAENNPYVDPVRPVGGNVVGHEATYRLYFKNSGSVTTWTARMWDSPEHARKDVKFVLNTKGVDDNEEEKEKILKQISIAKGEPQPDVKRTDLLDE